MRIWQHLGMSNEDFGAILLELFLQSYNSYLSAVTDALSVLGTNLLNPDTLMLSIINEFAV